MTVAVPAVRNGAVVAVVAAALEPDRLHRVLARWRAGQDGYVGVSDAARIVVARSDGLHEREQGRPMPPEGAGARDAGGTLDRRVVGDAAVGAGDLLVALAPGARLRTVITTYC